jgi:hypothetical protein
MAGMQNGALFAAQKNTISPPADADDGFFLPVPSQKLFPSEGLTFIIDKGPRQFSWPFFLRKTIIRLVQDMGYLVISLVKSPYKSSR